MLTQAWHTVYRCHDVGADCILPAIERTVEQNVEHRHM